MGAQGGASPAGGGAGGSVAPSAGAAAISGGAGAPDGAGGALPMAGAGGASAGSAGAITAGGPSAGSGGASPSGSVSFASPRVTVTGVRGTTSPAATSVIQLHNAGTSAVQVNSIALGGADAALFQVSQAPTFPAQLAAGADLAVHIELSTTGATLPKAPTNKDLGSVLLTANLTATLASGSALATVYGLVLTQANYEPTLGQILTTLGYSLKVGKAQDNWNPNTSMNATSLPGLEAGTDEVAASHFVKAGSGNVGLSLVARFSPVGALPYGFYTTTTGCPTGCTTVGTMAMVTDAQTSNKARMVNPPPGTGSMSTFDPGSAPFGLWVYSDQKTQKFNEGGTVANGDWDYSQDPLNAPANVHRFKSYPLKDDAGTSIPHTYLVAVEEAGNGDYQDYVFLLSNVTAMP
jgi:hypothetical protein